MTARPDLPSVNTSAPAVADHTHLTADELGGVTFGGRATFVQFSSNFCAPCRSTRGLLAWVAGKEPGVQHVELEVNQHLELAERLRIVQTPTFFLLDADGAVRARQEGVPRLAAVRELLAGVGLGAQQEDHGDAG